MDDELSDCWAVADTQVHRERVAIENLTRQGYTGYCPMIDRRIRHARRWRDVQRPLFPGYVFIRRDSAAQNWRPIFSTYGIKSLLCQGNRPSFVPGEFIESLKRREKGGVVVAPAQRFEEGQSVLLTGGSFDGLTATIAELDRKSRVTVLLNLLNGQVRTHVPIDGIREL